MHRLYASSIAAALLAAGCAPGDHRVVQREGRPAPSGSRLTVEGPLLSMWMEVAVVAIIFAVGNILMGHWEAGTPKWRRLLKFVVVLGLTLAISATVGRLWAFVFLGLMGLAAVFVHGWLLPRRYGINGWTGEPKEKYYAMRGWKYPPAP